jgi:Uma2 family endonuclease
MEMTIESTATYDLYHKLPKYEQIASLQEVVLIDRFDLSVSTFRRTESPNVWIETNYYQSIEQAIIDGFPVLLSDIFANLPTEQA